MQLILASTSPCRRALLERLSLDFVSVPPGVDESAQQGENPAQMALRLAMDKAQAVANSRSDNCLVLGSDQVACCEGQILGKPHHYERAAEQLRLCSGNSVQFYTAVAAVGQHIGFSQSHIETVEVCFRQLSGQQIDYYLQTEQPYDCAGSFKCEGLGIALFNTLRSDDPTALEGLPLIATTRLLEAAGLDVLTPTPS